ncbi:hypothetical protein EYF80_046259 [Liparis tanakae]|uniref:Uncharacterized protein n=1 Tax=Liparis tanakae TaxID=230148 RepID=A0A4Z2FQM9_9TELE|nr:hypothetical protein EYF80_046259 [Liparis tanakae]
MRQKFPKKAKSPKGGRQRIGCQGRQTGSKRAGSGIHTSNMKDRTMDNNPARDKGQTGTIYRGWKQVYDMRQERDKSGLGQVQGTRHRGDRGDSLQGKGSTAL